MRVKLRRIEKGLTQLDLRKAVQIGLKQIVEIERGNFENVKLGTMRRIAKVLDSDIQSLFFGNENSKRLEICKEYLEGD